MVCPNVVWPNTVWPPTLRPDAGNVLGAKRRAEEQRNHKDENRGAFHDNLIISAWEMEHHARR